MIIILYTKVKIKMKRNRIFLTIIVGILLLGFIPAVQANTTKRPIDDWILRELAHNPHILGWGDLDTGLAIFPHFEIPYYGIWGECPHPIWEYPHDGYILERELKDGKFDITVYLNVTDVPFIVRLDGVGFIFEGFMHYTFRFRFILDLNHPDYPDCLIDDDGNIIYAPFAAYVFSWYWNEVYLSTEIVSFHVNGAGTGEFTQSYNGWNEGDFSKVKINIVGMTKDFEIGHPNFHDFVFSPVDFIFFH